MSSTLQLESLLPSTLKCFLEAPKVPLLAKCTFPLFSETLLMDSITLDLMQVVPFVEDGTKPLKQSVLLHNQSGNV